MQNKKKYHVFGTLRENGLKEWSKTSFETYIQGGASLPKIKLTNTWKLWEMAKNKQSNLIGSVKMLNISVNAKQI